MNNLRPSFLASEVSLPSCPNGLIFHLLRTRLAKHLLPYRGGANVFDGRKREGGRDMSIPGYDTHIVMFYMIAINA
jgi:hypothetical protein